MIEAWATPQVYAAEEALMATLAEGELMARAVDGLAAVTAVRIEDRAAERVVGLIGTGNNGADALYALARLSAGGVATAAVTTDRVHDGALQAARSAGVVLIDAASPGNTAAEAIGEADIVLDGVLGIGGRPEVPEFARDWVETIPADAYIIAVDLPTGADPNGRGGDPGGVFADETVTFSVLKPVHLLPGTETRCGRVTVVDIGLTLDGDPAVVRLERDDVADRWPVPGPTDHKYTRGVLGVIAGSDDFPGAGVLTTMAAVCAGVGMVRYVGPRRPSDHVLTAVPEAVHGVGPVQAWVIGSGLAEDLSRLDPDQRAAIETALDSDVPVLIDAGGLDLLKELGLGVRRDRPTLLTPHAGECARLLDVPRAAVEADPIGHAERLAEQSGATVLIKGAVTVVVPGSSAAEGAPLLAQADGPPWLATAGTGDVLAGLAGALLAGGLPPAIAGALAALVHGVAADDANPGGPVRARDVAEQIPRTVARLLRR
ncbi:MAG TPA: bifunctional ADP-dependent NAD(P)H-hydrate dehydratase/NAD(P)H-hydrate epimerase [Intrasporangiaceae bacterium]|nr:bifunctional ADP-dependent NAD(P)H-hydrate dehydratase/NAD(P)H-hydrate epimerase [Intrasporangiaceae bacterium]